VGAIFLSSWIVMLVTPLATNGALLPGYWQVVWTEYILGSIAGVVTLSVKSVLLED
jgi:hypothetical protein